MGYTTGHHVASPVTYSSSNHVVSPFVNTVAKYHVVKRESEAEPLTVYPSSYSSLLPAYHRVPSVYNSHYSTYNSVPTTYSSLRTAYTGIPSTYAGMSAYPYVY